LSQGIHRLMRGFAEYGRAKIRAAHIEAAASGIPATTACPNQRGPGTARFPRARRGCQDFGRRRVDQTRRDSHYSFGILLRDPSQTKFVEPANRAAAHGSVLVVS